MTENGFTYPSSYEAWEDYIKNLGAPVGDEIAFKAGFVCGRMGGTEIERLSELLMEATARTRQRTITEIATHIRSLISVKSNECNTCKGSGAIASRGYIKRCGTCKGTGKL